MGSETSTSAAMGASSRTHSRKATITWASDQTSGFGGSACAASGGLNSGGGGSGVFSGSASEMEEVLCEVARAGFSGSLAAGGLAASGGAARSSSTSCDGSRFARDLRAASWKVGSAGSASAIGTGLERTSSVGAATGRGSATPTPEAAPCGSIGSVARPRTVAIESLFDTETMDLARIANDFAVYAMRARISRSFGRLAPAWWRLVVELWCLERCRAVRNQGDRFLLT